MNIDTLDFEKTNGLIPAIIQDNRTMEILMLGYMNRQALEKTLATKKVTFFSRTKNRLWIKGETSGNFLELVGMEQDCDNDTLLVRVIPTGPTFIWSENLALVILPMHLWNGCLYWKR